MWEYFEVAGLQLYLKRDSDTGVLCEFCEIFKTIFFGTPPLAASVNHKKFVYRDVIIYGFLLFSKLDIIFSWNTSVLKNLFAL